MLHKKISPSRIFLLFSMILSLGVLLGVLSLLENIGKFNPPVAVNPAADSKIRSAAVGEDFLIALDANPSTGYSWEADFDKNYLMLRSKDFVHDRVSPETVGAGGKEVFTFAPIKAGETTITVGYSRPWESRAVELKVFKYDIKEKTAADPKCGQKARVSEVCSKVGYEFDSSERECVIVNGAGCIDSLPFGTLEECRNTCETNAMPGSELKFKTIIKGLNGNPAEQGNYVIKSKSEWMPILQKTNAELPASIDFDKDMIIAVFQGGKSTGGYGIEINKIIDKGNAIEVSVLENSPGRGCVVTQALTSPFHIVKIQKSDKEVMFNIEKAVNNCQEVSQNQDICDIGKGDWENGSGIFSGNNTSLNTAKQNCEAKTDCRWKVLGGKVTNNFACCPKDLNNIITEENRKIYERCYIIID